MLPAAPAENATKRLLVVKRRTAVRKVPVPSTMLNRRLLLMEANPRAAPNINPLNLFI
jgi:hypothetical protein